MEDYEKVYEEFWKEIVEVEGKLNLDQIKRELFDYSNLLNNVPKVYCELTGGLISKPLTDPEVVIEKAHEYFEEFYKEDIIL